MNALRALVLRAPGINCDRETAQACRLVGFATDLLHINTLLNAPNLLLDYDFLVIPGGFSYGDDLGAGMLLAKNLTIHLGRQLQQFIEQGRPLLGICNGFQVLVRAGLLPGPLSNHNNTLCSTLTENASAQFECRWVTLATQPGPCIFTQGITHSIELPIAHGEGRFILADPKLLSQLQVQGQIPLLYSEPATQMKEMTVDPSYGRDSSRPPTQPASKASPQTEISYPYNPNGSIGNIAGICNSQGTVFGLMPHPERYVHALQHPQRGYGENGPGDGLLIFKNAYEHAKTLNGQSRIGTAMYEERLP